MGGTRLIKNPALNADFRCLILEGLESSGKIATILKPEVNKWSSIAIVVFCP